MRSVLGQGLNPLKEYVPLTSVINKQLGYLAAGANL